MSAFTHEHVKHLAALSRIDLSDAEVSAFSLDLEKISHAVEKVAEVASADIMMTRHPIPLSNVYRDDTVSEVLTQEQALSSAPDSDGKRFRVSEILEHEA